MPCDLFDEWIAFFHEEPSGAAADDQRFGILASLLGAWLGQEIDPGNVFGWQKRQEHEQAGLDDEALTARFEAAMRATAAVVVEAGGEVRRNGQE